MPFHGNRYFVGQFFYRNTFVWKVFEFNFEINIGYIFLFEGIQKPQGSRNEHKNQKNQKFFISDSSFQITIKLRVKRYFIVLRQNLFALRNLAGIADNGVFVNTDFYIFINFEKHCLLVDFMNKAMNTTGCNYFITLF